MQSLHQKLVKCDSIDNNMCESKNSWIISTRHKAVIPMIEKIRHKLMDRQVDNGFKSIRGITN